MPNKRPATDSDLDFFSSFKRLNAGVTKESLTEAVENGAELVIVESTMSDPETYDYQRLFLSQKDADRHDVTDDLTNHQHHAFLSHLRMNFMHLDREQSIRIRELNHPSWNYWRSIWDLEVDDHPRLDIQRINSVASVHFSCLKYFTTW
jgi:hypothetical protein